MQQNVNNQPTEMASKFLTSRIQAIEHRELEKLDQIKHENELLLNKLISISKGKQLSVGNHSVTQSNKPKTLHLDKKKHDAEKIDNDNIQLLQKITCIAPTIKKNKLEEDWQKQIKYKQIVQKSLRKLDLTELFHRRKEFLGKNFQILPGISKVGKKDSTTKESTAYNDKSQAEGGSRTARDFNNNSFACKNNTYISDQENSMKRNSSQSGVDVKVKAFGGQQMGRTNFSDIQQTSKEDESIEDNSKIKQNINTSKDKNRYFRINKASNILPKVDNILSSGNQYTESQRSTNHPTTLPLKQQKKPTDFVAKSTTNVTHSLNFANNKMPTQSSNFNSQKSQRKANDYLNSSIKNESIPLQNNYKSQSKENSKQGIYEDIKQSDSALLRSKSIQRSQLSNPQISELKQQESQIASKLSYQQVAIEDQTDQRKSESLNLSRMNQEYPKQHSIINEVEEDYDVDKQLNHAIDKSALSYIDDSHKRHANNGVLNIINTANTVDYQQDQFENNDGSQNDASQESDAEQEAPQEPLNLSKEENNIQEIIHQKNDDKSLTQQISSQKEPEDNYDNDFEDDFEQQQPEVSDYD